MPTSLRIHANERIDIEDFELAATGYTRETAKLVAERSLLARHPEVLESFMIEVTDQLVSPGQITVYNGTGFDRSGQLVHIEGQPEASLTLSLNGANHTFYVELEFNETASDVNSRGFWDPSVDNADPIPDGAEAIVSVATRNTPSWSIVTPVNTTAFDITSNPNSNRIPLAILRTDSSNRIDAAVNGFTSLVTASTVLESDVAATSLSVKVMDSRLFPVGSYVTVGFGGSTPQTNLLVTLNDYVNNILTFDDNLSTNHLAGAIVKREAGTGVPVFLQENNDPNDPAFALPIGDQPNDRQPRMWQGDEVRGSALLSSKYTLGKRDDLNIRSLADFVDSVAANVRDMKFGHPRADVTSNAPPSTFSPRPRHFDSAGSITGARTNSVSIGNGSTTFGDFNGTTDAAFTAAIAALPAGGGSIFVKAGVYTFASMVSLPSNSAIYFEGESENTVFIIADSPLDGAFQASNESSVSFEKISIGGTAAYSIIDADTTTQYKVTLLDGAINGIRGSLSDTNSVNATVVNSVITGSVEVSLLGGKISTSTFSECEITGRPAYLTIEDSTIDNNVGSFMDVATPIRLAFRNCLFTGVVSNAANTTIKLYPFSGFDDPNVGTIFDSCKSTVSANFEPSSNDSLFLYANNVGNIRMINCSFDIVNAHNGIEGIYLAHTMLESSPFSASGCSWKGNSRIACINLVGSGTEATTSIDGCYFESFAAILAETFKSSLQVSNSIFQFPVSGGTRPVRGIFFKDNIHPLEISITNCTFRAGGVPSSYSNIAIDITGNNSDNNVLVSGCMFKWIGNDSDGLSSAVRVSLPNGNVHVDGNTFELIKCSAGYGVVHIFTTSDTDYSNISVSNNSFIDCITATETIGIRANTLHATANVVGNSIARCISPTAIYAQTCVASVSSNTVSKHSYTSAATLSAVSLASCSNSNIVSNTVSGITSYQCRVIHTSGGVDSTSISVDSNNISDVSASSGNCYGIYINSDNVIVSANQVSGLSSAGAETIGIFINSNRENVSVNSNMLKDAFWGVYAENADYVSITANNIETSYNGIRVNSTTTMEQYAINDNNIKISDSSGLVRRGIHVGDDGSISMRGTVNSNTIKLGSGTTQAYGISVRTVGASATTVSNNCLIGYFGSSSPGQIAIYLVSSNCVVANNVVRYWNSQNATMHLVGDGVIVLGNSLESLVAPSNGDMFASLGAGGTSGNLLSGNILKHPSTVTVRAGVLANYTNNWNLTVTITP